MSIQFIWEDRYSVNDPKIDGQHKNLFAIGNELAETSDLQDIKTIIIKLFKYTREHFSAEEKMMENIGFPHLEEHKQQHEDLILRLSEISAQPFDNDEAADNFKIFVYNWLVNHVMMEDNKYFQFSNEQS